MLGKIEFENGRQHHEAWLDDNLTWRCDDDGIGEILNQISDGHVRDSRPNEAQIDGEAVKHLLYRVAYRVGGRVSVDRRRLPEH